MIITYTPINKGLIAVATLNCGAKLIQYAKNATFAPHFHSNFNIVCKKIFTSIPTIFL
ncbi:MAG: hypothetical protein K0Q79_342 [Flavipsychrobacter sp.]|jgi:hypothetical protein|nr:hypothetical protein [Flavipsychrobacter sp.]